MPHDAGNRQPIVLANARLVLEDAVVAGALVVEDGRIAAIETGTAVPAGAEDLGGDFLAPGLVELHTDNLERHLEPRPGVRWPEVPAILAHDAELAGCGITTVFDAMRVGSIPSDGPDQDYDKYARPLAHELAAIRAQGQAHGFRGVGVQRGQVRYAPFAERGIQGAVRCEPHEERIHTEDTVDVVQAAYQRTPIGAHNERGGLHETRVRMRARKGFAVHAEGLVHGDGHAAAATGHRVRRCW